jgi:hypothetical protein
MVQLAPHHLKALCDAVLAEAINCLAADELFMGPKTLREQCAHACRILRQNDTPVVRYSVIGSLLDVAKSAVRREWQLWMEYGDIPRSPGRPPILDATQTQELFVWIEQKWKSHQPASYKQVSIWLHEKWCVDLAPNTLWHTIRRIPMLRSAKVKPMEMKRLNVPDDAVHNWFTTLHDGISGTPAHFVYDMDEMGHQEYADAKPIQCVVPAYVFDMPYYEVSRRGKRITLIVCIAADGSCVRPALIPFRQTYDDELVEYGFPPEVIEIYSQNHAYIDSDIFFDWLKDTLVPDLQRGRVAFDYWGPAFLL